MSYKCVEEVSHWENFFTYNCLLIIELYHLFISAIVVEFKSDHYFPFQAPQ